MLLENKNAVIYGGGGGIGGPVARAFAREGVRVFLAGCTMETLESVAEMIRSAGGLAETARVDALDERAVDEHADSAVADAGRKDFASKLPAGLPVHFYHSQDDEWVPFAHFALYTEKLPGASIREFDGRGHQFGDDLSEVARDMQKL